MKNVNSLRISALVCICLAKTVLNSALPPDNEPLPPGKANRLHARKAFKLGKKRGLGRYEIAAIQQFLMTQGVAIKIINGDEQPYTLEFKKRNDARLGFTKVYPHQMVPNQDLTQMVQLPLIPLEVNFYKNSDDNISMKVGSLTLHPDYLKQIATITIIDSAYAKVYYWYAKSEIIRLLLE